MTRLHTVVELDAFARYAKTMMSDDERMEIIDYLAANPKVGISLGGGLHKMRMARRGMGKRGGFRVFYIYVGERVPLLLVTVFAKNEKDNIGTAELAALIVLSKQLVANYGG